MRINVSRRFVLNIEESLVIRLWMEKAGPSSPDISLAFGQRHFIRDQERLQSSLGLGDVLLRLKLVRRATVCLLHTHKRKLSEDTLPRAPPAQRRRCDEQPGSPLRLR